MNKTERTIQVLRNPKDYAIYTEYAWCYKAQFLESIDLAISALEKLDEIAEIVRDSKEDEKCQKE